MTYKRKERQMSKETKVEESTKTKLIDKAVKTLAYIAIIAFTCYGLKALLINAGKPVAYAVAVGLTLLLTYIIFKE